MAGRASLREDGGGRGDEPQSVRGLLSCFPDSSTPIPLLAARATSLLLRTCPPREPPNAVCLHRTPCTRTSVSVVYVGTYALGCSGEPERRSVAASPIKARPTTAINRTRQ